ncbi:MAG: alpha/beta hydrolase [Proteobacteria bacterium]|nr:alpha/beta hydrolase [Pseudomonadota bacterium]
MEVSFVDVDGANMRYYHAGAGKRRLLLVHGFGMCADAWSYTIDGFADDFEVFAPDLLGHGYTDWIDFPDGVAPQQHLVHYVGRFMDAVGIDRCCLAGSSLGGVLAALLYRARPEQIDKLVFVGIDTPVSETGAIDANVLKAAMANGTKAMQAATWDSCRNRMANICFDRDKAPADIALMQMSIYARPGAIEAYRRIGEGMIATADSDAVRMRPEEIKVPTLMLCGSDDPRAGLDTIKANHGRIANCEWVGFDECGHLPHIEHPQKFVETVAAFLNK